MLDSTPLCRTAFLNDITNVVKIHMAAFPGFFLTTLGPNFLSLMYRSFLLSPSGIFVVHELGGQLNGFAVGVLKTSRHDNHLAILLFPQFVFALLPAMLRHPIKIINRVVGQFFSTDEEVIFADDTVVLRSIGVFPASQGTGVANSLINEFERKAQEKGKNTVILTTDAINNERAISFYHKHGYSIMQEFKQNKTRPMLLMAKNLQS